MTRENFRPSHKENLFGLTLRNKIIILACGVSLLTSLTLDALVIMRTTSMSLDFAVENVAHEARLIARDFKASYNQMRNDAFVISRTPPIQGILRSASNSDVDPLDGSTSDQWNERLETIFSAIMEGRSTYTQIRYIGVPNNGRELVRVNRGHDGYEVVARDQLQEKSGEAYFQRALALQPGEAYFSKVTYNREFGKVENSLVPTLRVVVPIFDSQNQIFGIIVINADYSAMLRERLASLSLPRDIIVTNEAGDYMEHHADGSISKFHYQTDSNYRLPASVRQSNDLRLEEWVAKGAKELAYSVRLPISRQFDDSHIVITIRVPNAELYSNARLTRLESIVLAVALMLMSLAATAWLATKFTEPLQSITRAVRETSRSGVKLHLPTNRKDEIGKLADAFQNLTDNLTKSEAQVRAIFDNVVDSVITIDGSGVIQNFNPASESIFGYAVGEVIGKNIKILMPEAIAMRHDGYLEAYRRTGEKSIIGATRELEGRRKDGSTFPMELSVSRVDLGDTHVFTGIVRDITERKQIDVMKNQFVSTVNHELRTPLTSIQASLGILQKKVSAKIDPKEKRLLDISLQSCERLGRLVNDILDLEKIAAGKMDFHVEPCDICWLVESIVERHLSLAETHHVNFDLKIEIEKTYCSIDPARFNQALVNLLSNAAKFSPKGETVTIRVSSLGKDRVSVSVADNGPGIPSSFRDKVFNRFAQADGSATRAAGGSGLGLSITKSIIEAFGGEISFESVEGDGATFFLNVLVCEPAEDNGEKTWRAA